MVCAAAGWPVDDRVHVVANTAVPDRIVIDEILVVQFIVDGCYFGRCVVGLIDICIGYRSTGSEGSDNEGREDNFERFHNTEYLVCQIVCFD